MSQPTNPLDITEHGHGGRRLHSHAAGTHQHDHMQRAVCCSKLCAGTPAHNIHVIPEELTALVADVDILVQPTEYCVSVRGVGADDIPPDLYIWDVFVQWRGDDAWAVTARGMCLSKDGTWDYEPLPSDRDEEFLLQHRFDLDTALALAKKSAETNIIVGRRAIDVIAETRERTLRA